MNFVVGAVIVGRLHPDVTHMAIAVDDMKNEPIYHRSDHHSAEKRRCESFYIPSTTNDSSGSDNEYNAAINKDAVTDLLSAVNSNTTTGNISSNNNEEEDEEVKHKHVHLTGV